MIYVKKNLGLTFKRNSYYYKSIKIFFTNFFIKFELY